LKDRKFKKKRGVEKTTCRIVCKEEIEEAELHTSGVQPALPLSCRSNP
jgi:hypothetical protein